ncbi:MAG: hypothetical protein RLY86_2096 [Pseudomonadota bacterium]|jgi:3(or 17)beta-hydroxysteroid dehydrogenase
MTGRVQDKVIMVTGAASGIGLATAKLLARQGAVVIMTDRNAAGGAAALAQIHGRAEFHEQDVTKEPRWEELIADVVARHGRLDGLVNNAGVGSMNTIENITMEELRFVHSVNVDAVAIGCKHAIRTMKTTGGGAIVNISSVAGLIGAPMLPAYCASKGAVRLLTKSIAVYCAQQKYEIRCNSVHPSFLRTAMVQSMIDAAPDPARMERALETSSALGRMGEPEDAGHIIVYLCSDESRFVTGAEFVVDGGLTAR